MTQTLNIGDRIELVEVREMEVVRETTGVLEFPTYEVFHRDTCRYRVVNFDEELKKWILLKKADAIRYYEIAKSLKKKEKLKLDFPPSVKKAVHLMTRNGKYEIDAIMPYLKDDPRRKKDREYMELDGVKVKTTSKRYMVFKKSLTCADCGLVASFFAAEKSVFQPETSNYHFNLYGIGKDGNEVMFTKDHIVPKAEKGSNRLDNLQTMCIDCNTRKGCSMPSV